MFIQTLFASQLVFTALASPLSTTNSAYDFKQERCTARDPCWPDATTWTTFNASISGRLIASRPSAARCHDPTFEESLCQKVNTNWTDSRWRTDQPGAYSALLWEVGDDQCFPDTSRSEPCGQGLVAEFSVNASEVEDIQASVKFAKEHNLYLTIKNTGHDHLGRSSGGSFAIWTHNMKGREWHDSFVPSHAPGHARSGGEPAVTLQAGEQWIDVYEDADTHGRIVVGGSARTVGAAGGYLTGGGHSPFSFFYGLAADNLLEVSIVTPQGDHRVINKYTDPEYFWAIRGGGGSAWGVITSVTYKTHPQPSHVQVAFFQANMSTPEAYGNVYKAVLKSIPAMTDAGYTGYGSTYVAKTLGFVFLQPNGTNETLAEGRKALEKALVLNGTDGISTAVGDITFPSWAAYRQMFVSDPNIATNIQDASRLMTAEVLTEKTDELVDLALRYAELAPGHNFIGKVNPAQRANTSVHPVWADSRTIMSFGVDWPNNATAAEKKRLKEQLVNVSQALEGIVGSDGGTYINEANPYEPRWQEVFWGRNYARLEGIKKRIDPSRLFVCNRCVGTDIVHEP